MTDNNGNIELSRRKVLAGLGTVGLASAGAGLGTSAYFSDVETFTNNQLVAGELDMKVGYDAYYSDWKANEEGTPEGEGVDVNMWSGAPNTTGGPGDLTDGYTGLPTNVDWLIEVDDPDQFLDNTRYASEGNATCGEGGTDSEDLDQPVVELDDVKPGDFGEVTFDFALCDNPGYVWLSGGLVSASENGTTEPEAEDPDEEDGVVELLDVVQVAIWIDNDNNYQDIEDGDPVETVAFSGSLRDVIVGDLGNASSPGVELPGTIDAEEGGGTGDQGCFAASTQHSVAFAWWVPVDHGNEIQGDSATFDLGFYTEQCRHNDGSGMAPEGQTTFTVRIENVSGPAGGGGTVNGAAIPLSPGAYAVHSSPGPIFEVGQSASPGLEDVAEDGRPSVLASEVAGASGVSESGAFGPPNTVTDPNQPAPPAPQPPIFPGGAYEFEVTASPGDALSFATMFIQSNDLFYAPDPDGIALFDGGSPVSGDVTDKVALWDASTEEDQAPGVGDNQAPRQSGLDTGPADSNSSNVELARDVNDEGYSYPSNEDVIEVTITPQ